MPIYGVPKVRGLCSVNQRSQFRFAELKQRCFERRTSTGAGGGWSFGCFCPNFRQIQSITVKRLTDTNFVVSRHIKRKKGSLPVDVRHSKKTSLLSSTDLFPCPILSSQLFDLSVGEGLLKVIPIFYSRKIKRTNPVYKLPPSNY